MRRFVETDCYPAKSQGPISNSPYLLPIFLMLIKQESLAVFQNYTF